jgi:hypothetical protein
MLATQLALKPLPWILAWQLETLNIAEMLNLLGVCEVADLN